MASLACAPTALAARAACGVSSPAAAPAGGVRALPARPFVGGSVQSVRGQPLLQASGGAPAPGRAARLPVLVAAEGGEGGGGGFSRPEDDGFEEQVVQVRRVTKVVKGGKQLSFRAVVVVGNRGGEVGVGCAAAKEVVTAVQKAAKIARAERVTVPITRGESFPHRITGRHGAAKIMLRPAAEGSGVSAGGATRVVMELAGIRNGFGKQLGTSNALNNARATVEGLSRLRTWQQVADSRGLTVPYLMGLDEKAST